MRTLTMKTPSLKKIGVAILGLVLSWQCLAADYVIDTKDTHAFITFKIPHLGYSMLLGQFKTFEGQFSYDPAKLEASTVSVTVDIRSLDSNHGERDKHLKGDKFIDADKYPTATFTSTSVKDLGDGKLAIHGNMTLHGVTKPIVIAAQKIGEGMDPWGGYRAGFSGTTTLKLKDFGIPETLGPASTAVEMELFIEGVKQTTRPVGKVRR
jgi:polyisoprenoid-binding protein YceI